MVIWFHPPHLPVVASQTHRQIYEEYGLKEQLYYGAITAMDEQVGRLWAKLGEIEERKNTMLWFCSDNGPENGTPGSSGPFRERKRSLYEGGVRVPAFCTWENGIQSSNKLDFPVITSDYFPTILDMLNIKHQLSRPMDGMSIVPVLAKTVTERMKPMGFLFRNKMSWVTHQHKLISVDGGKTFELYDLLSDPGETVNIADRHEELVKKMKSDLKKWMNSVNDSRTGADY